MADNRKDIIQMLAKLGDLPEEEIKKILAGITDEIGNEGEDPDTEALLVKIMEEKKEKKKKDAEKVCKEITDFFVINDWKYSEVKQNKYPLYVLNFKMRNLNVSMRVIVEAEEECIRFDTVLPVTCKKQNHIILSYELTKINMPLRFGAFHLDTDDDEISYRYSLPYSADSFSGHLSGMIILAIAGTVDEYYETVMSYAHGQLPEEQKNEVLKEIQKNVEFFKSNS